MDSFLNKFIKLLDQQFSLLGQSPSQLRGSLELLQERTQLIFAEAGLSAEHDASVQTNDLDILAWGEICLFQQGSRNPDF